MSKDWVKIDDATDLVSYINAANARTLAKLADWFSEHMRAKVTAELVGRSVVLRCGERTRILALPGIETWEGTYQLGRHYEPGMFVAHDGSVWIALKPTDQEPGTNAKDWQLVMEDAGELPAEVHRHS
jgi:hypothetical protein